MARDYKYRAQQTRSRHRSQPVASWRWIAAFLLAAGFAGFLMYLRSLELDEQRAERQTVAASNDQTANKTADAQTGAPAAAEKKKNGAKKPQEPRFDFYTILPKQEVVVPEHEIKTRKREEHVGKAQPGAYVIQAASFRNLKDADALKARLAMMGIESTIESAQVGSAQWYRIKIGPLSTMGSVDELRMRLRQQGIDAVVMQIKP